MEEFSKALCNNPNFLDGQRFNCLTVICFDRKSKYGNLWKCRCDCGNIMYATTGNLTSGRTKSCGCLHDKLAGERNIRDLSGEKFGMLTVISRVGSNKYGNALWNCECDCGGFKIVSTSDLKQGRVKSCGCLKSLGEKAIAKFLDEHKIDYMREYTFPDCKIVRPMPFDFYIPNYKSAGLCIEYDGIQHFKDSRMYSNMPLDERFVPLPLHRQSQMHLGTDVAFHHRELILNQPDHLCTAHLLDILTILWLAETSSCNLCNILLSRKVQV